MTVQTGIFTSFTVKFPNNRKTVKSLPLCPVYSAESLLVEHLLCPPHSP